MCVAYTHYSLNKFEKIEPRGKKNIFVDCPETSKGYMFIFKHDNKPLKKFKSQDTMLLERVFPKNNNFGSDRSLYEMQGQVESTLVHPNERYDTTNDELVCCPPHSSPGKANASDSTYDDLCIV